MAAEKPAKKSSPDVVDDRLQRLNTQRVAVAQVRARRRDADDATAELDDAVALARSLGVSWHGIGVATGLTAEGARRRWHLAREAGQRRRAAPVTRSVPRPRPH